MSAWGPERMAKIGIAVQMLILIRLPAEVFRLQYVHGNAVTLGAVQPFIRGELITAVCAALSVGFFFWKKHQAAIWVAAANVLVLIVYKMFFM